MRFSSLLIAAAVFLTACDSTRKTPVSSGETGGTLIIAATAGDVQTFFPPFVGHLTDRMVQDQIFDRLAEINGDLNTLGDKGFSPRLAQKWTWSRDSLSIAFSIDPRARWHDGKPVTAGDVRYSFKIFVDPKVESPVAPLLSNIDSVSVRDSLTAVVWFKKRTPEQFYDIAYQLIVLPEHVYGAIPAEQLRTSEVTQNPIGSGRFRFVRWDRGTRIELVSDTANFRGRAKLDRVIFSPLDIIPASTQILAGQADVMEAFPIDRAPALDSSAVARGVKLPNFSYAFMVMNQFDRKAKSQPHPIFSDIRVRRALAMAVDRRAMLKNVFGDNGRLSYGPFAMTLRYSDSTLRMPPFDTTAAKALLDSAGWVMGRDGIRAKNGRALKFSILAPSESRFRMAYAVLLQGQLKAIGAQAEVDNRSGPAVTASTATGDYDATLAGFSPDPAPSGIRQYWSKSGIGEHGMNFMRYSNPFVDAQIDSATATFDVGKMKQHASKAFQAIIDDAPAIFLYDFVLTYGVHRRVIMAETRPDEWWANLADWSISPDKRIERDGLGLASAQP